jgi:hypothetical protein
MADRTWPTLAAVAALLLAGLAPAPAHAAKYNNIHCYGSTSMRAVSSNPFSGDDEGEIHRRFKRAIFDRGWEVPDRVRCFPDVTPQERQKARHNLHNINSVVVELDVPPTGSPSPSSPPAATASPPPATLPKADTPPAAAKARDPAQEKAFRAAQDQMDKSVAVALADALRTGPKPAASSCRTVERPAKVTAGYGPTREEALSQAIARTNSCKVVTTHCLENTKTEFTREGRPKVAGKFWDCRVSYSCGETQEICTSKPAAASKQ